MTASRAIALPPQTAAAAELSQQLRAYAAQLNAAFEAKISADLAAKAAGGQLRQVHRQHVHRHPPQCASALAIHQHW